MSDNPFSFQGKIKRGPYFLCCLALMLAFSVIIYSLLSGRITDAMVEIASPDEGYSSLAWVSHFDTTTQLILIPIFLIYGYLGALLLWKRTRDMNGSMSFAYVYVGLYLAMFIPTVGAVASFLVLGMNLILFFKPSTEFTPFYPASEVNADGNVADKKIDRLKSINAMNDADLVARANSLRDQQEAPRAADPDSPITQSVSRAPKSFGRRSLQGM